MHETPKALGVAAMELNCEINLYSNIRLFYCHSYVNILVICLFEQ